METGSHFSLHLTRVHIARIFKLYLHLHALQIVSAFCLSINCAPTTSFCSNLLTRSSSIAYWLTVSRPVDPVHCNPSSARIRGSGKNPQCPNVRFASWLYLYRALDCNYFDEMHEVTKVCRVQHCFEEKMFKTLVALTLRASCVLNQHLV